MNSAFWMFFLRNKHVWQKIPVITDNEMVVKLNYPIIIKPFTFSHYSLVYTEQNHFISCKYKEYTCRKGIQKVHIVQTCMTTLNISVLSHIVIQGSFIGFYMEYDSDIAFYTECV